MRVGNHVAEFHIEPFARECLLEGVDTLGWLRNRLPEIEAFERQRDL